MLSALQPAEEKIARRAEGVAPASPGARQAQENWDNEGGAVSSPARTCRP